MRKCCVVLLAAGMLMVVPLATGLAQNAAYGVGNVSYNNTDWATVQKGDVVLFGLLDMKEPYTRQARAGIIANERLAVLERNDLLSDPGRIQVGVMGGEVTIYVNNPANVGGLGEQALIVTVDTNIAGALKATPLGVATYWCDLLRLYTGPTGSNPSAQDPVARPVVPNATWRNIPEKYRTMGTRQSGMGVYMRPGGSGSCCGG